MSLSLALPAKERGGRCGGRPLLSSFKFGAACGDAVSGAFGNSAQTSRGSGGSGRSRQLLPHADQQAATSQHARCRAGGRTSGTAAVPARLQGMFRQQRKACIDSIPPADLGRHVSYEASQSTVRLARASPSTLGVAGGRARRCSVYLPFLHHHHHLAPQHLKLHSIRKVFGRGVQLGVAGLVGRHLPVSAAASSG